MLKKLGISDFRHMTKDKIVQFASMLPYMDPEVAKCALEQFPSFRELAVDVLKQYKFTVDQAIESNKESQKAFYNACNTILVSLQKELEDDTIDSEERSRIEDKMIFVAGMIGEKDTENKKFIMKMLGAFGILTSVGIAAGAAILGSNTQLTSLGEEDGYDNNILDV